MLVAAIVKPSDAARTSAPRPASTSAAAAAAAAVPGMASGSTSGSTAAGSIGGTTAVAIAASAVSLMMQGSGVIANNMLGANNNTLLSPSPSYGNLFPPDDPQHEGVTDSVRSVHISTREAKPVHWLWKQAQFEVARYG